VITWKLNINYQQNLAINSSERKTFWAKFFADQIASGLSAKKFCKLHQLFIVAALRFS
jgi:hypothetical protein